MTDFAQPRGDEPTYGIFDPDYARVFTIARCIAWSEGYALAMHGSFTRDLDLLAVPWTGAACDAEHLARRIEDAAGLKITKPGKDGEKPHGRLVWTMMLPGFSEPRWVDLSILPRISAAPSRPVVDTAMVERALNAAMRERAECAHLGIAPAPRHRREIRAALIAALGRQA